MPVSAKARGMLTILAIVMCLAGAGHVYEAQGQTTLTPTAVSFNCTNLAEAAQGDPLRTTFLGVSTLLFDDGETQFLTDGFFSRPLNVFGQIEPDLARITSTLQRAGIARLAAVIPFHSHYDHAMDAPEVAKRTGAFLIGSESTANIGRGWGLSEERIRVFRAGERLTFGRFDIDVGLSRHSPGSEGGIIAEPLKPPVPASAYKEGGTYPCSSRTMEENSYWVFQARGTMFRPRSCFSIWLCSAIPDTRRTTGAISGSVLSWQLRPAA